MFDLATIQRPNRTLFEVAMEQSIQESAPDLSPVARVMDPETCPPHLLGWLAWALSVDVWDAAWDEATKRRVLSHSLEVHRRKGTVGAIRRALSALFADIDLQEWQETGDAPHSFRAKLSGFASADVATVKGIIERTKPARSQLSVLQFESEEQTRLFHGAAVITRINQTIQAAIPVTRLQHFHGAGVSQFTKQEVPAHG